MRILIIAYVFPPSPSVGGFRPYSWYKYFSDADVYPIVITRNWSQNIDNLEDVLKSSNSKIERIETANNLLIKLPHKPSFKERFILKNGLNKKVFIRKTISILEEMFKHITPYLDDKYYIYEQADDFLSKNKVDCILVSGEPFILFKYAHKLSEKYNIPWFADYRDGWTTNHTWATISSRKKGFIRSIINRYIKQFEQNYTKNAIGFSSVAPQIVTNIETLISKKGLVVPNGADLELINSIPDTTPASNEKLVIVYTGIIYEGQRVQEFLDAYESFIKKGKRKEVLVKFIGINLFPNENVSKVIKFSEKYPENLVVLPKLSHRECIVEQKKASVLLSFILGTQSEGVIGAKTYEYLAIKKPIIVIPLKEEKNPPLFPDRSIQHFAYSSEDIETLLERFYNQFKEGENLTTDITNEELNDISRKKNALILAEHIKNKVNELTLE